MTKGEEERWLEWRNEGMKEWKEEKEVKWEMSDGEEGGRVSEEWRVNWRRRRGGEERRSDKTKEAEQAYKGGSKQVVGISTIEGVEEDGESTHIIQAPHFSFLCAVCTHKTSNEWHDKWTPPSPIERLPSLHRSPLLSRAAFDALNSHRQSPERPPLAHLHCTLHTARTSFVRSSLFFFSSPQNTIGH